MFTHTVADENFFPGRDIKYPVSREIALPAGSAGTVSFGRIAFQPAKLLRKALNPLKSGRLLFPQALNRLLGIFPPRLDNRLGQLAQRLDSITERIGKRSQQEDRPEKVVSGIVHVPANRGKTAA